MTTQDKILKETDSRMQKSIESLNREMSIIRTGRANPSLVEDILVDYYGVPTPLNQLSSISIPEARVLMIQPWDKQSLKDIEKGIQLANIGLTPNNDGTVVRLSLPILTEERRRELVRMVKRKVEDGHVSIRNIRRDSITILRNMEKNSEISQDESRRSQDRLQILTDGHISKMNLIGKEKESEVMEV
jgi:ribosome recycling factor